MAARGARPGRLRSRWAAGGHREGAAHPRRLVGALQHDRVPRRGPTGQGDLPAAVGGGPRAGRRAAPGAPAPRRALGPGGVPRAGELARGRRPRVREGRARRAGRAAAGRRRLGEGRRRRQPDRRRAREPGVQGRADPPWLPEAGEHARDAAVVRQRRLADAGAAAHRADPVRGVRAARPGDGQDGPVLLRRGAQRAQGLQLDAAPAPARARLVAGRRRHAGRVRAPAEPGDQRRPDDHRRRLQQRAGPDRQAVPAARAAHRRPRPLPGGRGGPDPRRRRHRVADGAALRRSSRRSPRPSGPASAATSSPPRSARRPCSASRG